MQPLQKYGGLAAIAEALIYITLFVIYGAILEYPASGSAIEQMEFLHNNQGLIVFSNMLGYVIFGIVLSVLTLALYERFKSNAKSLAQLSAVFGFIWVAIIISSGMISNVGLEKALAHADTAKGYELWTYVSTIAEGLGGGNEIVGGVWVLLLSFAGLKDTRFSRPVIWLGFLVGSAGVLTIYPAEIIKVVFGLSQIVWFTWLGIHLLKDHGSR